MREWSIVCTVDAPSWLIALHARYHLQQGASKILYFLDGPQSRLKQEISDQNNSIVFMCCDDAYWERFGGRPKRNAMRQFVNLQTARTLLVSDWILHIDIDEFLYFPNLKDFSLMDLPEEVSEIRVKNVERVFFSDPVSWFDGYLRVPTNKKQLLLRHYGATSNFLGMGLTHYYHGKSFVANRSHVQQNNHGANHRNPLREVIRYVCELNEALIVHLPCMTDAHFMARYLSTNSNREPRFELAHQRRLRIYLELRAKQVGAEVAIMEICKMLHFSDSKTAAERLSDGLYQLMPREFIAQIEQAASHTRFLEYAWANESFKRYYS